MWSYVLFPALAAALVTARPEAGYSYQRPNGPGFGPVAGPGFGSGFGSGSAGFGSNSAGFGQGGISGGGSFHGQNGFHGHGQSGSLVGPGPLVGPGGSIATGGASFGGQSTGGGSFGFQNGGSSSFQQNGGFNQQTGFNQGGFTQGAGFTQGGFTQGGGFNQGGFTQGGFNQGFVGTQAPLIQKHIYVHVPPPDPEEHRAPHVHGRFGPPQKHYKIIFIKAPSGPQYDSASVPLPPQNEEKTLVYVLVKKPEDASDIYLNNAPTTPPSKPEVYFIKYKTQKDQRQGQGIGGQSIGGDIGPIGGSGPALIGGSGGSSSTIGTSSLGSGSLNQGPLLNQGPILNQNGPLLNQGSSIGPAPQYGPPAQRSF